MKASEATYRRESKKERRKMSFSPRSVKSWKSHRPTQYREVAR